MFHERFPDHKRHAARIFGDAGYQTWLLGLFHETYLPETLGFDRIDTLQSKRTALDLPEALDRRPRTRDPNKPFYCQPGSQETHRPWSKMGEPPDESLGVTVPDYLHDGPLTRDDLAHLHGSVSRLDRGLGGVLAVLEDHGLADNTILVVTTDHGIPFPRTKTTLYDSGIGVYLFLRYPGGGVGARGRGRVPFASRQTEYEYETGNNPTGGMPFRQSFRGDSPVR